MFATIVRVLKRIFRPQPVVPTVLEAAVLELEEAQRRHLYFKERQENAEGNARITDERIRRLGRDITKMMEEGPLDIEVRREVRRANRNKNGGSSLTALQIAQRALESEELGLLGYQTEAEDAKGTAEVLAKRIMRLRSTVARFAAEREQRQAISLAAAMTNDGPAAKVPTSGAFPRSVNPLTADLTSTAAAA